MKKVLAMMLASLMIVSILPMSVLAAEVELNLNSSSCDFYNLIEKTDYNLAPGAVESEIILNDDSGNRRQVVHVIEVDPNNDNISVMPTFKNISADVDYTDQTNWGSMEMSKQSAYIEETLGKNVVGSMNVCLSWDFSHPYGLLVYEGKVLADNRDACPDCGPGKRHPGGGYLVIYKDGKAELRDPMEPLTGDEWMAQTVCFSYLVKDGVNVNAKEDHSSGDAAAPRSVIGVKADGTLVLMMVDGRMAPYSTGFTNHEMSQMMLDLGCVDAINCDGGGSSTFITEREGSGELSIKSRFSDGSERVTLTGIAVISKAVADGKFDHAAIEVENKLVTPGSTVNFIATGADSAGGPAEIPENVTWQLKDASFGTIANGVFVSNGKTGAVTAQMVYEGKVVGEATVEVVIPDSLSFVMANITAPYTKTVSLDVIAKYGYSEVALKDGDIEYALSDAALGTISGIKFTATSDEAVKGGTVTATLTHNRELTATANLTFGKGSEIVYDFENGPESIAGWTYTYSSTYTPDKYHFNDQVSVVSVEEGGKVRNGNYALKVTCDGDSITCMNWCSTKINGWNLDLTDAVSFSFWIYIPEGSHGYEWDFGAAIPVVLGHEFKYGTGWQYLTVKVADIGTNVTYLDRLSLYHSDTNNTPDGYVHSERPNYYADVVYYVDDVTINYSSAVEDNDAPVISDASVSHANIDSAVAMNGQDIDASVVAFTAKATDNIGLTNYTGLDVNSLIVLVDGKQVNATCSENGFITTGDMELANGVHTVVFKIADNNGNYNTYKEYSINIVGNSDKNTIKYVPANPELKEVLTGSVVWMNLVATEIEKVSKVTVTLDLDQNSKWELDHMILAAGFTAEYVIDAETNDATITFTATGAVELSGEAVLATMPIRVWVPDFLGAGESAAENYRLVSVMTYVQMGELVETDATVSTFASAMQVTSTEWKTSRLTANNAKITNPHIHTAEPLEDVDATCTVAGYTGRTFCEECNSVVDWGTTVEAKGHEYESKEGALVCKHCGDASTTTGLVEVGGNYYYVQNGNVLSGWQMVSNAWHYFDPATGIGANGDVKINDVTFNFVNGKLTSGVWAKTLFGTRYYEGPTPHRSGWYTIDGKDYCFENYQIITGGYQVVRENNINTKCYYFEEDGSCDRNAVIPDGFITDRNGFAYIKDGSAVIGLQEIDGVYYYFSTIIAPARGYAQKGNIAGYLFGDDYKAVTGLVDVNGELCYYENGKPKMAGLVEIDGDLYFAGGAKGQITVGKAQYVWQGNGILPEGMYEFDAEGKLVDGIVDKSGTLCYYENGQPRMAGLIEVDGAYYFAFGKNGEIATGSQYVWQGNGLLPEGTYEFGADGAMLNGIVEKDGSYYYYENGRAKMAGLVEIDGAYYFAGGAKGEITVNKVTYIWKNEIGVVLENPNCEFGADGKMLDGIVEKDGVLYYYVMGRPKMAGLINIDGDYYFAGGAKGEITVGKSYYVWQGNGLLPEGTYEFGADGAMLNGIVEKDGVLYYYVMGRPQMAGLVEVGGDYYFAGGAKGEITVGKSQYVWLGNGLLPEATYAFGDDGKMLDGFVTKPDGIYYYEKGQFGKVGLTYIDGSYYFVDYGGKLYTSGTYYIWETNGLSIKMNYTFDSLGRIVK